MLAHERQSEILKILQEKRSIRILEISERFNVSCETARRDLEYMQKCNLLRRIHGGAIMPELHGPGPNARGDSEENAALQEKLAQRAVEYVEDDDILFVGPGAAMGCFARYLKRKRNITVLTNSLYVINELMDSGVEVYVLGGRLDRYESTVGGSMAGDALRKVYADKAFITCGGATITDGITDYSGDSNLVSMMLDHAETRYLTVSSNKFGRNAFSKICDINYLDVIISDTGMREEHRDALQQTNVSLQLVEE